MPNIEPYVPLLTALATLANTCLLIWNRRKLHRVERKVNGMYLQTIADAEHRGRHQAIDAAVAKSALGDTEPRRQESH